ncbi:MAG: methyltransferase domain-containing protein [Planctomycetota bacterium]
MAPKDGSTRWLMLARRILPECLKDAIRSSLTCWARTVTNKVTLLRNGGSESRKLEIGARGKRIQGFETLDIKWARNVDYVLDASKPLPFSDDTFEVVYASHILEHIPWYKVEDTLKEWTRIIKPGSHLELWVPNGLKICKVLMEAETNGNDLSHLDGWYKYNPEKDPCVWAAGRLFTYGDGKGDPSDPNWHRALFTPRYLKTLFEKVGLTDVRELRPEEVRGYDHGWINLGMVGTKE